MPKYIGVLLAVDDIAVSRAFYEGLLGQKVDYDFGVDVAFGHGLTIHQRDHFQGLLGGARDHPVTRRANNGELYFEEDDLEPLQERLKDAGTAFIHEIREQPWAQRVMRVYDPDGFVVEFGESMEATVRRLHKQGLQAQTICQRTSMPLEFVEKVIGS